ncbi:MAG: phage portal protein [Alphaproteobacteria bacterium]|nr:phage portal protein [Alphaproteobacteria bacterium]
MGLIRRIAERIDPAPPAKAEPPVETRGADLSWQALAGTHGGFDAVIDGRAMMTPRIAENLAAYSACIAAIAGALASFPVYIYKRGGDGREIDNDHPVARLIREGPNAHQAFPDFLEMLVSETLAHGNGLVEIVSDRSGRIKALIIIPWRNVTPVLLKSGRLVYDVSDINSIYGGTGKMRRLLDSDVLHLRDRSDDGLIGRSRLSRCASPVRAGIAQESYGAHIYENQAAPGGILSIKDEVTEEEVTRLLTNLKEVWQGVRNAGEVALVTGSAVFTPLNITPENLEMISARRFTVEEIARIFQVPPPIIGDYTHNTFTNSQSAGRWFGQFTLMPWVRKLEETIRRSLFSESERATHEIEFDMTSLLRSDPEARWQAHEIAVKNNILTANEVREVEGWNSRPEMDGTPPGELAEGMT